MPFEVQTYTLCQGWINCWMVDDEKQIFETYEAAQDELDEFMADIQHQIDTGERAPDEGYDLEDYRIVEISEKPPALL